MSRISLREPYVSPEKYESTIFKGVPFTDRYIQPVSGYWAIDPTTLKIVGEVYGDLPTR
jgi:hypothetical protein